LKNSEYQVACFGEGVETLTQMVFSYNSVRNGGLSDISGIVYKDETGTVRVNTPRENVFVLDEYPFPSDSIDLFLDDLEDTASNNRDLVYVYAGFGCPYRCLFCAQRAIHKGRIRERSAENVFEEMKKLWGKGFRRFALVQETFLINRERINRFCHLIESSGLKFEWTLEARADQLDLALLRRMKDAGLKFIQIGMETGDQELLDRVGKKMRVEHMKKVRNWCKQLNIDTTFYMLVGLPGQHWQSILRSAVFLRDHTPYNRITKHVPVSIAIPYPGTKIAEDGSVRLVAFEGKTLNWPDRNPEITVNEEGEFAGKSFTKTNDMTSEEILEALIYLVHFGQFHLHAKYDTSLTYTDAVKARDCANRMLYMMERRAIRDLIIRAQECLTPDARQRAYEEILERDAGAETHFKDVTALPELRFNSFTDFLTAAAFTNGFDTMKCLSIPNRIKWMKLCSVIWELAARKFNEFRFEEDREAVGRGLDGSLEGLSVHALNRFLERLDNGTVTRAHFKEFVTEGNMMKAFGLEFWFVHGEKSLIIRCQNSPT
jgi:hypothetical protein